MEKNLILKNTIWVVVLLIVALVSIFAISPLVSSTDFHAKTIKSLDDKKITVMELTAATAGASTALAAIPGDATTPLANQILGLSSYLLVIIGAIFLEKILLTLTGYVTFTYLIPIACLLYGINIFTKNDVLKKMAIKLGIFGIVIFVVVPLSVQVSNLIENTYQATINQSIEEANDTEIVAEENTSEDNEESKGWSGFTSKVKDSISSIGDGVSNAVQKGKQMLSNFIDAIAILLITSCIIPIVVLISFAWIVKIIFNVNIPLPNLKKKKDETKQI